jgi:hypothetical protein
MPFTLSKNVLSALLSKFFVPEPKAKTPVVGYETRKL